MSDYGIEISLKHGSEPPIYDDFGGKCTIKAVHFTKNDVAQKAHLKRFLSGAIDFERIEQIREASVILPPGMGSGRFSGTLDIDWPLTQQDYDELEYLVLWAEPLGAAALKGPGSRYRVGMLVANKDGQGGRALYKKGAGRKYKNAAMLEVEVFKSVVSFTVDKMMNFNHGSHSIIEELRKDMIDGKKAKAAGKFGPLSGPVEKFGVKSNSWVGIAAGKAFGGSLYDDGFAMLNQKYISMLDLKPVIEKEYGSFIRIGNNGKIYFYDVFSNINWGYTGQYIGFDWGEMNRWAAMDPTSAYEPQDAAATALGHRINARTRDPSAPGNGISQTRQQVFKEVRDRLDQMAIFEAAAGREAANNEKNMQEAYRNYYNPVGIDTK